MDSSIITDQQELYVNIDIDHGSGYGQTIFVEKTVRFIRGGNPAPQFNST